MDEMRPLTTEEWEALMEWLNRPAQYNPKLAQLILDEDPFTD